MNNTVGIIGLGYVGLPLLIELRRKKFNTFGFDKDSNKIKSLRKKKSPISDVLDKDLNIFSKKNFCSSDEYYKISLCDYIIFCLPTPFSNKKPDMSFICDALKGCYNYLRENQTIILESTVYPGATEKIFVQKLSKKFILGKNFYLCFSPERIDPGRTKNKFKVFSQIDKLISGYTKNCLERVDGLYSKIFKRVHKCESIKIAEMSKLYENSFRSVNIALANEFKMMADKMNINIFSVLNAASTKPFGFTRFNPGPGVGGHCIPIDPLFLKWISKKYNFKTGFIDHSHNINLKVTKWVINKISKNLLLMNSKKILFLGATYKKDVNDVRESPALKIINNFKKNKSFKVDYYDPYINKINIFDKKINSIKNLDKISSYDVVILLVDHSSLNFKKIHSNSKFIIDTRGIFYNFFSKKVLSI
jgi:UDP-N-acetyl-D-glucosamine dehydrogenase